jgi:subtilisin family serine protease
MEMQPTIAQCDPDSTVSLNAAAPAPSSSPNTTDGGSATPNDPLYSQQYGLHNINASTFWSAQKSYGNRQITICHVDSGVDPTHPDLVNSFWVNPGEIPDNGIDDDNDGIVDDVHGASFSNGVGSNNIEDAVGHGTHTAGIMGATGNNGIGTTGVQQVASTIVCRFITSSTSGSISDAVLCLNYCVQHGANIISCSWGGSYIASLDTAIQAVTMRNVVVVTSAGNNGQNTDATPQYPSAFSSTNPSVIGVAALQQSGALWPMSNYGTKTVQLGAPGVNIVSTTVGGQWGNMSGTSMAGASPSLRCVN